MKNYNGSEQLRWQECQIHFLTVVSLEVTKDLGARKNECTPIPSPLELSAIVLLYIGNSSPDVQQKSYLVSAVRITRPQI